MNPDASFWKSKTVLVTGHTGFKGGWLAFFLSSLGAKVYGYALAANTSPNFFELTQLKDRLAASHIADIRDFQSLSAVLSSTNPEIVFHLAAQPLVRRSYLDPIETYHTNVMGTVNLLQGVRACSRLKAVVVVTTDKCYENQAWPWGYRETDQLGGHDPYSNSKACQELVTAGFRSSYLTELGISVATARAGNVIGGGDWSEDRLIPDAIRAYEKGESLAVRNPSATRPWQHVLEPASAYMLLAQRLFSGADGSGSWNFGPLDRDVRCVKDVLELISQNLPRGLAWRHESPNPRLHEAKSLKLDCSKAQALLNWWPRWNLETAINQTCDWYAGIHSGNSAETMTSLQIKRFIDAGTK
jgi:CDP-glucose 4,6-dehydratase